MLIAILVLLGLAGAIWYFAHKQTQAAYSLTAEQTAELNRQIDLNAALATADAEPVSAPSSPSVEQIDAVLAEIPVIEEPVSPVVDPIFELPSEKVKAEIAKEETVVVETTKPPKKKRRYYPKKK